MRPLVPVGRPGRRPHRCRGGGTTVSRTPTHAQGQYLAYIYWYTKVHRRPPSENEIAEFLAVRGPSAHRMILGLENRGYLSRTPGQPRTLKVLPPREDIPNLD
ncbi:MAG: MarR family transcriptional regulator [Thermoplasmata archaeon]